METTEHAGSASGQRTALAACNLCEAICGLELTIEDRPDGRLYRAPARISLCAPRGGRCPDSTPLPPQETHAAGRSPAARGDPPRGLTSVKPADQPRLGGAVKRCADVGS